MAFIYSRLRKSWDSTSAVKPLLYVYRVLLTGLHLMRHGEIEANLLTLNETARLPYIDDLVERKLSGPEKGHLAAADVDFHRQEFERLVTELRSGSESSTLSERASAKERLNDLLVRLRLPYFLCDGQLDRSDPRRKRPRPWHHGSD